MKIISWNVNGLRSASDKGFLDYILQENADVVCLQEIKAHFSQLGNNIANIPNYNLYLNEAQKAGYSYLTEKRQLWSLAIATIFGVIAQFLATIVWLSFIDWRAAVIVGVVEWLGLGLVANFFATMANFNVKTAATRGLFKWPGNFKSVPHFSLALDNAMIYRNMIIQDILISMIFGLLGFSLIVILRCEDYFMEHYDENGHLKKGNPDTVDPEKLLW